MNFIALLFTLGLLSLSTSARVLKRHYKPYNLTAISVGNTSGRPGDAVHSYHVSFEVWDHNKVVNASTVCKAVWDLSTPDAYPQVYVPCEDTAFQFKMEKYEHIANFTLQVTHTFKDKRVGRPPHNVVTTFAKKSIDYDILSFVCGGSGVCAGYKKDGLEVLMPVYKATST